VTVLLTGWFSFGDGEVTAGDLLALAAVERALDQAAIDHQAAWSPGFRPGALRLEDAVPGDYTHLVFVCGPLHGPLIADLHTRFAGLRRIAVGVTVIDPGAPACTGFDRVLARDGGLGPPVRDLSAAVPWPGPVPERAVVAGPVAVTGVILTGGQGEYGGRRRHESVTAALTGWLAGLDCAPVTMETRLDIWNWGLCSTAAAFECLLSRMDVVVTTRLHGLALALRAGIPALAVDPVDGGGKVTAQASAWDWPAVLPAEQAADHDRLDALWRWCRSPAGRAAAVAKSDGGPGSERTGEMLAGLVADLRLSR